MGHMDPDTRQFQHDRHRFMAKKNGRLPRKSPVFRTTPDPSDPTDPAYWVGKQPFSDRIRRSQMHKIAHEMTQNDTTIPQQPSEKRPKAERGGQGWLVTCPKCERNYLVMRKQIMDGSWIHCPFCGKDQPEPGDDAA